MEFFQNANMKDKIIFCKTLARHFRCHLMPLKSTNKQLENYLDKKQKSQKPSKYAVSSSFLLAGDERIEFSQIYGFYHEKAHKTVWFTSFV